MRLLIITQKVDKDDPILGFFHRWIEEFSKNVESVIVICLQKGAYDLPKNVEVHSLGKEKLIIPHSPFIILNKLRYVFNFYKLIFKLRNDYGSVFVHMNPEYLVLGGVPWRFWDKKIGLWYVHRAVNFRIWLAEKFTNVIFTSTLESFRLKSKKVSFVGHGIDISKFNCEQKYLSDKIILLHVGRITKIKNCDVAIRALPKIIKNFPDKKMVLRFVGPTVSDEDVVYLETLKKLVEDLELGEDVEFVGSVNNKEVYKEYCACDATLNMTPTGGMDKVVLESLASKRPVFTSNPTFSAVLRSVDGAIFNYNDSEDLSKKISDFIRRDGKIDGLNQVYENVRRDFSLTNLVVGICKTIYG